MLHFNTSGIFVADISVPDVSGWGDFFRWVGAAAASIIVWEWVERIEYVEREEKKGGILGNEIYEEDEMDGNAPSDRRTWTSRRRNRADAESATDGVEENNFRNFRMKLLHRHKVRPVSSLGSDAASVDYPSRGRLEPRNNVVFQLSIPDRRSITPTLDSARVAPSSEDTAIASDGAQEERIRVSIANRGSNMVNSTNDTPLDVARRKLHTKNPGDGEQLPAQATRASRPTTGQTLWNLTLGLITRRKRSPPLEVKAALNNGDEATTVSARRLPAAHHDTAGSPTVVQAPPRGQTWSPNMMRHSPVHAIHMPAIDTAANIAIRETGDPSVNRTDMHRHEGSGPTNVLSDDDLGVPVDDEDDASDQEDDSNRDERSNVD